MMKFQEIRRRLQTEAACLSPVTLGICAGVAALLGAVFSTSIVGNAQGILLPRTLLPSFFHILFQLFAYAILGAAFAALLKAPCRKTNRRQLFQYRCALLLFVCVLILCYLWVPVVCIAESYFLGILLCSMILLALFILAALCYPISIFAVFLLILFSAWMLYLSYITASFLVFF